MKPAATFEDLQAAQRWVVERRRLFQAIGSAHEGPERTGAIEAFRRHTHKPPAYWGRELLAVLRRAPPRQARPRLQGPPLRARPSARSPRPPSTTLESAPASADPPRVGGSSGGAVAA